MKILIVDDIKENLYMLETLLRGYGYEVKSVADGVEALEKALQEDFDLIISDILMPRMDGFQLCREVKKNKKLKKIAFVFYTATYTHPKDEEFALSLGAERFIVKPAEPDVFIEILKEVIKSHETGTLKAPKSPIEDETVYLREYSERLVRKLEDKMLDLERVNAVLRESEEKYRDLIDNANDAVIVFERTGYLSFVNPKFCKMTGYSIDEAKKLHLNNLIHPDDLDMCTEYFRKRLAGEKAPRNYEVRILTRAGRTIYIDSNVSIIEKEDRISGVLAIMRDITERKQAGEALRESEERLKTILDSIQTGIVMIDAETRVIVDSNPAAIAMIRAPKQKIIGHVCHKFICPVEEGKCPVIDLGQTVDRSESLLINADGESIPILRTVTLIVLRGHRHLVESFLDITERKQAEEKIRESLESLRRALEGTVHALSATAERRDPYTAGHQQRVTQLACAIAGEIGLPEEQIEGIRVTGILHDIGKIYVPAEILNKPGRLTEMEMGLIKTHPQVGYDILKTIEFPWPIAQIVIQHHERIDGSGYPSGLSGEDILLEARILAVADVIEAMASHRPYRPALGIDKALEEISQNKGNLYDPEVADACVQLFNEKEFEFE